MISAFYQFSFFETIKVFIRNKLCGDQCAQTGYCKALSLLFIFRNHDKIYFEA